MGTNNIEPYNNTIHSFMSLVPQYITFSNMAVKKTKIMNDFQMDLRIQIKKKHLESCLPYMVFGGIYLCKSVGVVH